MENVIVIGCRYHTTWQTNKATFILEEIKGDDARLSTKSNQKGFWTKVKHLKIVNSKFNKDILKEKGKL